MTWWPSYTVFFLLFHFSLATLWWQDGVSRPPVLSHIPRDQVALVSGSSEILGKATAILASIETAPSCHRSATTSLLGDCSRLNGSATSHEKLLEDTRSEYAAALALCELREAGASIPAACEHISSRRELRKGSLEQCLGSLKQEPQSWTSYSNNRRNAHVICAAVRSEVEQAHAINVFKGITETFEGLQQALTEALDAAMQHTQKRKSFAQGVDNMEQVTFEKLRNLRTTEEQSLAQFFESLRLNVNSVADSFAKKGQIAQKEVDKIYGGLDAVNTDIAHLQDAFQHLSHQLIATTTESVREQQSELLRGTELANGLRQSLEIMVESYGMPVLVQLETMHGRLATVLAAQNAAMDLQERIYARSSDIEHSLQNLEGRIGAILGKQEQQLRIQYEMQFQMSGLMNTSVTKLADLDRSIDDLSQRFSQTLPAIVALQGLIPIVQQFWDLKWLLGAVGMFAWHYRGLATRVLTSLIAVVITVKLAWAALDSTSITQVPMLEQTDTDIVRRHLVVGVITTAVVLVWMCTITGSLRRIVINVSSLFSILTCCTTSEQAPRRSPGLRASHDFSEVGRFDVATMRRAKDQGQAAGRLRSSRAVSLSPGL